MSGIAKKKKYTIWNYLGFGLGAFGMDLSYGMFYTYFSKYLTDTLKATTLFMFLVPTLARIWDGINDPMMGTIVDNTKSRWGKFRPWILIGAATNAVVLPLLFTNPGMEPGSHKLMIYAAVMYVLWGMTNTMCDISYWSMIPALTNDPDKRNLVSTIPRLFSGGGQLVVAVATVYMVSYLGGKNADGTENTAAGYSRWAMICGVVLFLGALAAVSSIKEKGYTAPKDKFSLKSAFKAVTSNDQLLVFMLTAILFNTGWYLTTGMGIYYFDHVRLNDKLMASFSAVVGVGQLIGLVLVPPLSKKIGRRKVIIGAMAIAAAGYIGMIFFGVISFLFIPFAIFALIGGIGVGAMFVCETIMLADIVDYGEYHLGYRSESIVFSMKGFLQKFAYTVQSLILACGIAISDYKTDNESVASKNMICVLMFVIPPVLIVLALLFYRKKYKLYGPLMDEVNACVSKRRAEVAAREEEKAAQISSETNANVLEMARKINNDNGEAPGSGDVPTDGGPESANDSSEPTGDKK